MAQSVTYFIEYLTLGTWLFSVWPRLFWRRLRNADHGGPCYVVDACRPAMILARVSAPLVGSKAEQLSFVLTDLRDEKGQLIRLRLAFQDLAEVQQDAMTEPAFQKLLHSGVLQDNLPRFLAKNIASITFFERGSMWRSLLLVHICAWQARTAEAASSLPQLIMERRPWMGAIRRYGRRYGVEIRTVRPASSLRAMIRNRLSPQVVDQLRLLRHMTRRQQLATLTRAFAPASYRSPATRGGAISVNSHLPSADTTPRAAVEYYGQLNLEQPERHSDLAFWQQSDLPGSDLLVTFALPQAPLDEANWQELHQNGISAVALRPDATTVAEVPIFEPSANSNHQRVILPYTQTAGPESRWLEKQLEVYDNLRSYWTDLFAAHQVKVHVTWYKYDANHFAIGDALRSLGGVATIYQRAYESHPSAETMMAADIVFGFSPSVAAVERLSRSQIRYHVTTGYIGDHRHRLLKNAAQKVRSQLQQHGAQQILSFTDENSGDDSRWHTGHPFMRANYAFLLEKVLANPWLGILLKPKTPGTLRRRLGPVAELLAAAEATGRCYIYDDGVIQGSHSPAEAALAADVAVHGHLCAATAGIEAALAGTPTLLLDREGWPTSPLYQLGTGQVAFTDWDDLWQACLSHWSAPEGSPGFGDWSSLMAEIDPFRDGKAAQRMGTYIQWLLEGFREGFDRETVMSQAAERYCAQWGADKITEVNSDLLGNLPSHQQTLAFPDPPSLLTRS